MSAQTEAALCLALRDVLSRGLQASPVFGLAADARGDWQRVCATVKADGESLLLGMLRGRVERRS